MIGEIQLPEFWVIVITIIIVPVLGQIFKLIMEWRNKEVDRFWVTVVVAVISLIIAGIIVAPQIPVFEDPMEFLVALFGIGAAVLGYATVAYNLILSRLFLVLKFATKASIIEYAGNDADNGNVGL